MWQTLPASAILHSAAVSRQSNNKSHYLALLVAAASWVCFVSNTPTGFAGALTLGLFAAWLGWYSYRASVSSNGGFRAILQALIGGTSGIVTSLLAIALWTLVWPEVAARQAQQREAHVLLSNIETQSDATIPTAEPRVSTPGGVYSEAVTVTLANGASDSIICYTLDGSEPTVRSPVYSRPILMAQPATLNAKAFRKGFQPSSTISETYFITDRDLKEFSSNLPLVIINANSRQIMQQPKTRVFARFVNTSAGRTRISGPADYTGEAEIHYRGSSTLRFPKRSYSLTTGSDKTEKQKVSIFGLPKDSDWVLYAPYQDKTLMRDFLAYELSREMGHYASRTKFVEVFVHNGSGKLTRSDYMGVFVFEEKIKRGKNRVNVESLSKTDNSEPNISGGYIFKRDHADRNENGFYTRYGGPYYYVYPKDGEITSAQRRWLHDYMNRFETALYGPNFADRESGYRAYLDLDSFIDHFWLIEMSKNVDGFRYSVFLHKDRGGKLKVDPVWDWNLSFGNADYYGGQYTSQWYHSHLRPTEISWYRRLRQDPEFAQQCVDRWGQLRTNIFSTTRLHKRIDEIARELQEAQQRNFDRWGIMGERVHANSYVGRTYRDEVTYMKRWIGDRLAWIDNQFLPAPKPAIKEPASTPNRTLVFENSSGTIYYTLDGSDPRAPGGKVAPGAKTYSGPIALTSASRIVARAFQSEAWSSPSSIEMGGSHVESAALH